MMKRYNILERSFVKQIVMAPSASKPLALIRTFIYYEAISIVANRDVTDLSIWQANRHEDNSRRAFRS